MVTRTHLSAFDDMTLVELIVERGEAARDVLPKSIRQNADAMAEAVENNVRRIIRDEMAVNPKYYEKMSELLDTLIHARKNEAIEYKAYLAQIVDLARSIHTPETHTTYSTRINTAARRALYDNLGNNEELAVELDTAIQHSTSDNWRTNHFKEHAIRKVVREVRTRYNVASADTPPNDDEDINTIMDIVRKQHDY